MSDSPPSRSCTLPHERRTERPVAKEGSRETGLRDEIEHLARGHDGLGCRDALLREPIDLPGERLDLSDLLGAGRAAHSFRPDPMIFPFSYTASDTPPYSTSPSRISLSKATGPLCAIIVSP